MGRLFSELFSSICYFYSSFFLKDKNVPEGGLLPGSRSGLLSNTWEWIVQGDTCTDRAKDIIGKGNLGGREQGERTQEDCSAMWLAVSGFIIIRLVFQLVSGQSSYLCLWLHLSVKMVTSARVSGRLAGGCLLTPYALSWILPAGSSFVSSGFHVVR